MSAWYERGEVGEYLLDLFDSVVDEKTDPKMAVSKMKAIGMSEGEIREAIQSEIDIVEFFDGIIPMKETTDPVDQGIGMIAENVIIENSPNEEISDYVFRCAESIGVDRLGGFVKIIFEEDMISSFAAETDGNEDRVDIRFSTSNQDEKSLKINIAHEFVHVVQILTGRLINIGLTLDDEGLSYRHMFDGVEYRNLAYDDHPWEAEAYRYEEEIYEAVESGSKKCPEVQSALYPY